MFKVSVQTVYPSVHSNADNLELISLDGRQYVVQKGLYNPGDKALAIPKGALLNHPVFLREWGMYLNGPESNIVGNKIFRGKESEGIVVRQDLLQEMGFNINDFELDVDISNVLGISKYIPPIPDELKKSVEVYTGNISKPIKHDCKYPVVYADKFTNGDNITITSKLHGTQINIIKVPGERIVISSKGLWDDELVFKQGTNNIYDQAWQNMFNEEFTLNMFIAQLSNIINNDVNDHELQIIGEVIPAIKGFNYGLTKPTLYIYSIYVNGYYIDLTLLRRLPNINIVPELYRGVYDENTLELANNFAQQPVCPIDGITLNEGVVISNSRHHIKIKNERFLKKHSSDETT
jgi:RNA ligase (TIGR02306 family)